MEGEEDREGVTNRLRITKLGRTDGWLDGWTYRRTDRWKGKQTDRQTDRLTLESEGEIDSYFNKLNETNITHTIPSSAGGCCGNIKQVNTCD